MRSHRNVVTALAMIVLTGCIHTRKIEVWADPPGQGEQRVKIDESKHDSVIVHPGDRIAWICHCPGMEFTIEDLHYVGNLDDLADALSRTPAPVAEEGPEPDNGAGPGPAQDTAIAAPVAPDQPAAAPEPLVAGAVRFEAIGDVVRVVRVDPLSGEAGGRGPSLFVEGGKRRHKRFTDAHEGRIAVGPSTDAEKRLLSTRVSPTRDITLWKFTWRVWLKGRSGTADTFDPHIVDGPHDRSY